MSLATDYKKLWWTYELIQDKQSERALRIGIRLNEMYQKLYNEKVAQNSKAAKRQNKTQAF